MKKREESCRLLFDNNPMPMCVFDVETDDFLSVNDSAVQRYGYERVTMLGMKLSDIWPEDKREMHSRALRQVGDNFQSSLHWRHLKADGSEIEVLTFGRRIVFEGCEGFLVAAADITERRRAEARVAHMAHHDGLTDLSNRVSYQERLWKALARSADTSERVAVHRSRPVQERQRFVRYSDWRPAPQSSRRSFATGGARRQSGGATGRRRIRGGLVGDPSPREASGVAARLIAALSVPYDIDGIDVVIGASIGIALSPGDGASCEE